VPGKWTYRRIGPITAYWTQVSEESSKGSAPSQGFRKRLLVSAHMKVDQTQQPETIKALAEMILLAANAQLDDGGH